MWQVLAPALLVFLLRIVDITLYTLRLMMVVRGRKLYAFGFAFFQSIVFITVMRAVITDLHNYAKILGYAAGFATGMVVGMLLEERLALGYTHLRIISPNLGAALVDELRDRGYAVTEIPAYGKDAAVSVLYCFVIRRETRPVIRLVTKVDPDAFITAEAVRPLQKGFFQRS